MGTTQSDQRRIDAFLVRNVLAASTAARAKTVAPEAPEPAAELWKESRAWLRFPDVVGIEVAPRTRRGMESSELTLTVLVQFKGPQDDPTREIPRRLPVPGTRRSVPTDIEAVGDGGLDSDPRFSARRRPCEVGTAIRSYRGSPATFACLLKDSHSGRQFLLSNSHVIAKHGHATPGLKVFQPRQSNRFDDSQIGALAYSIPVRTGEGFENTVDAAIALLVDSALVSPDVYSLGSIRGLARKAPAENDAVRKFGPATGYTTSTVSRVDATVAVRWKTANQRTARAGFKGVVRCTPKFTAGGDSGSAVLTPDNRLIGLHFASFMGSSFFIPIGTVLARFEEEHGLRLGL